MSYYVENEENDCEKCGKCSEEGQLYICPECEVLVCWECYESGSQVCEDCNEQLEDLDTYLEEMEDEPDVYSEEIDYDDIETMMFPNGRDGEITELFIIEE